MLKKLLLTLPVLAVAFGVHAETLEIAGSNTVNRTIVVPTTAKAAEATGIQVKMLTVGSVKGLQSLIEGRVPVAAIAEDLPELAVALKKDGISLPPGLKFHELHVDRIVPIVHPDNPVSSLSKKQLKDIYTGKVTNWSEVGGPDLAIRVLTPPVGSATRAVIQRDVLDGDEYTANASEQKSTVAKLGQVARDKASIGYVGAGVAETGGEKVKEIKGPGVSRSLGFVTVGEPSAPARKLIDYLRTAEARKLFLQ